jgi:hypothetical protein
MPLPSLSSLSSFKTRERNNLADRILCTGIEMLACSYWKESSRLCVVASKESRRCAECVQTGKSCDVDNMSELSPSARDWKNLAKAKDQLKTEIEQADAAMAEIVARLAHLQKQRKLLKRKGAEML